MINKFYYILAFSLFLILITLKLNSEAKVDWSETYRHDKSTPYATEIFYDYVKSRTDNDFSISEQPIYNTELEEAGLLFAVSSNIIMDRLDIRKALDFAEKGGTVFLSARSFNELLLDTFNLKFEPDLQDTDSNFIILGLDDKLYNYRFSYRPTFFLGNFVEKEKKRDFQTVAESSAGTKYWIKKKLGDGEIHFHSFPYVFSNYFIMQKENRYYLEALINKVFSKKITWLEYYSTGRKGKRTPLRYVLANEGFKKAIYLTVASILIFMFFSLKRRAAAIPLLKIPQNISLDFIKTLGLLLYQQGKHRELAMKRFKHFQDFNRKHYYLSDWTINDILFENLSKKSSIEFSKIKGIFEFYLRIKNSTEISKEELIAFNEKLEEYYKLNSYKKELI